MKKQLLALLLGVALLLSSVAVVSAAPTDDSATTDVPVADNAPATGDTATALELNFEEKASNSRFSLAIDKQTTYVRLTDKITGQEWYTNPPIDPLTDAYLDSEKAPHMRSVLQISFTGKDGSFKPEEDNDSYMLSVSEGAYKISQVTNGIRVDYSFIKSNKTLFKIPVQYTLAEDGLIAEVLVKEIEELSDAKLNTIVFLKFFGAANMTEDGYMIVPDGSGAIINLNNGKTADKMTYKKVIYGEDQVHNTSAYVNSSRSEAITLPVFGMVKNGYGFLAEIESGAELATLNVQTSGHRFVGGYNVIYTGMEYRMAYKVPVAGQATDNSGDALFNAEDPTSLETYKIHYHFSDNDQTTYSSLASMYRNKLIADKWIKANAEITNAFNVEFYGAVSKKKSFVGILYNAREKLTTFEQAQDILQDMQDNGVDKIEVQYVNNSNDFFNKDLEIKLTPTGAIGGKKGLKSFFGYTDEKGINVATAADFMTIKTGGNGYSVFRDTADAINISPIEVYPVSLNSNTYDTTKYPYKLVEAQKYGEAIDSLKAAMDKYAYTSFYFDDEAVQLYSDLAPDGYQAERAYLEQIKAFAALKEAGASLTMSNPNAYLYQVADNLVNIPVCSSKEVLFDRDIPFLQIVLRGGINFAGESMNITDVSDEAFLRHIEYGTNIRYSLIDAQSESLLNTDHTFLYSATYSNFLNPEEERYQIKDRYLQMKTYGDAVGNATITSHEYNAEEKVATVKYSNGKTVYVNYNAEAATVNGVSVDGMSFAIV